MRPLNRKLLRDLWRIRMQAAAIALVMACGIAIMLMSFGAMRSLSETRDTYYERYQFADIFANVTRAPFSAAAKIAAIPGVAAVDARIVHNVTLDIPDLDQPAIGELVSLPAGGHSRTNNILLRQGRLPRTGSDEVLMSENLANANHYRPGDRLQATINGKQRSLTVVGIALSPEFVYVLGPGQLVPDNRSFGILWLDRETLEAAYDLKGAFNNLSVALMPHVSQADVISRMDDILDRYGGTGAYGRDDQLSHAFIQQELDQLWTLATILPPIFLCVAAFLINMIMSRLIDLDHEQIGLLKAFGYSNAAVGWHYLKFTAIIACLGIFLGTFAGLLLGARMTRMYQEYFHFPFLFLRTDPAVLALSAGVALAASVGGTGAAIMRAVRLAPAVAMIPPAPTNYRSGILDRLNLTRFLSEPTRMIFRHIGRWPLRSLLTAFGISLAAAVLIAAFFMFDAIEEMVDSTYFRINRQDATVTFYEPRSMKSAFDVAHLPGVREVEPIRQVSVRLHHGHLVQRVQIYGSGTEARLKRLLDSNDRPITVPAEGIVLSSKLAELLDMHRGEVVAVDILEGARRKTEVPVSGIVSEYIGVSAYMNINALNRLTGEAESISGAHVLLDTNRTAEFFAALKNNPSTGIVTLRSSAIRAFRETMARSMLIVISFYVGFGAVISFGICYNTARIAISERGRELASLRVLGFTKIEAGYILLGELVVLVLLALPFGAIFGYGLSWFMSSRMETKLFRVPFIIQPSTYGTALVILIVSAAISLIAAAIRVGRIDLLSALKAPE